MVRPVVGLPLALLALAVLPTPTLAQPGAERPRQIDCAALAALPNPPMTREACEAMSASAQGAQSVMASQEGARPGDDRMSCDQIIAELRTQQVTGVSAAAAQRGQVAGQAVQAELARQQAEGAAETAGQTAMGLGAAAASVIPGGGMAAQAAMMAQHQANVERGRRNAAAMNPLMSEAVSANAASMNELTASMQANPRFGRLIGLAGERGCSGDF